jgi:catechol 2,3-dioxygenase-like lactoylglutathione lyase family enzyme
MKPEYSGAHNIALKVPPHEFDATVRFYRDVLGLEPIDKATPCFEFGPRNL